MNSNDAAKSCYDPNRSLLHATASHAALMVPPHAYLEQLSAPSAHGNDDSRVTLSLGTPQAAPEGARLLYEGPLPEGTPCRLSIDAGTRWLIIPNHLSLQYS